MKIELDESRTSLPVQNGMILFVDKTTKFQMAEHGPILTVEGTFDLRRTSKNSRKTHEASKFQKKKALKRLLLNAVRVAKRPLGVGAGLS